MTPHDYLKKPYRRCVVPDDDMWRGEIIEFPGCLAVGDTAAEALTRLEEVAEAWLEGAIERGLPIAEPTP